MEDEKTIDAIHRLMLEISETRGKAKRMGQDLKDIMEQNDDYRAIAEELKTLTLKRTAAKKILEEDKDYQVINTELDEIKFKLKDLGEIMSHHLVTYYNETHDTQIKDSEGEIRQVVISAKIGKPGAEA